MPHSKHWVSQSVLRDAAIKPATLRAYDRNLNKFLTHTRLTLPQLFTLTPSRVDRLLSAFFDHSYDTGGSYDYASQTLFGLIYRRPTLRSLLGESRLRLRGWGQLKVSRSHPPITWELTVLFAVTMASWSFHSEAVAILVAFDCYLRVGELTRLVYRDVVMPHDPRLGSAHTGMALHLGITKTGLNQWVSMQNDDIAKVLLQYVRSRSFAPTDRIFPFTPHRLRALLRSVSSAHGLGSTPFVPHSFRHGGATNDYLRGRTIEQIMYHGRWKSMESARRYIQQGRSMMISVPVASSLNDAGAAYASRLVSMMAMMRRDHPAAGVVSTTSQRRVTFDANAKKK